MKTTFSLIAVSAGVAAAKNIIMDARNLVGPVVIEEWGTNIIYADETVENGDLVTVILGNSPDTVVIAQKNCDLLDNANTFTQVGQNVQVNGQTARQFTITAGVAPFPELGDFFLTTSDKARCNTKQIVKFTVVPPQPTLAPTFSPSVTPTFNPTTSAPTFNPTTSPTSSPIEQINTRVQWSLPQNLVRFKQKATITESETITFDVTGNHNLLEFPTKESFDQCDFSVATLISLGFSEETIENFQVGQVRWFGCNNTQANGDVHCELGQKMAIKVINRGAEVVIPWLDPNGDPALEALYASPRPVEEDNVIRFEFDTNNNNQDVFQIFTQKEFDDCDFTNAIEIRPQPGDDGFVVYHDFFLADDEPKLWFACKKPNHCQNGQKVQVLLKDATNAPTAAPEAPAGDNLGIIVGAIVGGAALIAVAVFMVFRSRKQNGGTSDERQNEGLEKMNSVVNVPMPQRGQSDVEVAQSPYTRQTMQSTTSTGTSSLARSKAALSGLNF